MNDKCICKLFFYRIYLNQNEVNFEMKETGIMKGTIMEGQYFESEGVQVEIGLDLDALAKFICGDRWEDLLMFSSQPRGNTASAIQFNVNYKTNKWAKASLNLGKCR